MSVPLPKADITREMTEACFGPKSGHWITGLDFPSPASISFLKNDFDGVGTAAALCRAAERSIDAAHAQTRRLACNGRSQLGVAEDVAGTNDHAVLLTENTDKDRDTQHAQQHSAPDPDQAKEGRRRNFCAVRTQRRLPPAGF